MDATLREAIKNELRPIVREIMAEPIMTREDFKKFMEDMLTRVVKSSEGLFDPRSIPVQGPQNNEG